MKWTNYLTDNKEKQIITVKCVFYKLLKFNVYITNMQKNSKMLWAVRMPLYACQFPLID